MAAHKQRSDAANSTQTSARLLAAYDDQLRTDAETPSAVAVSQLGPLRLVTFAGGRGFVSYRDLEDADAEAIWTLSVGDGQDAHPQRLD